MRIFTTIEAIEKFIVDKNRPVWRMYAENETTFLFSTDTETNITSASSVEYLKECLNNLDGQFITLKIYTSSDTGSNTKNSVTHYIKIPKNNSSENRTAEAPINNMVLGLFTQIKDLELKMIQRNNEIAIADLERKLTSKNPIENPVLMEMLKLGKEYLLVSKLKNTSVNSNPVVVTEEKAVGIFGNGEREQFSALVKRWQKADPNFISVMEAIVFFAENDNALYKLQTDVLKNQIPKK